MNITYSWKISSLTKAPSLNGLSDVITGIRFEYSGIDSDSGESHTFHGGCSVQAPDPESFTEIGSITQEQVISWAQNNQPTGMMNEIIETAIYEKLNPKNIAVTELEWLNLSNQSKEA